MTPGFPDIFAQASFWLEPAAFDFRPGARPDLLHGALRRGLLFRGGRDADALVHRRLPPPQGPAAGAGAHPQHAAGNRLDRHSVGGGDRAVRDGAAGVPGVRHAPLRRRGHRRGSPAVGLLLHLCQRRQQRKAVSGDRPASPSSTPFRRRFARALHSRLPGAAERRAGPHRVHVVQARPARHVPCLLHAVLRQRPFADEHGGRGAGCRRLRRQAGRAVQHLRRSGHEEAAPAGRGGPAAV